MHQLVRDLLWRGHAGIREDVPLEGTGEIVIQNQAGEIGAVVVEKVEVRSIGS